MILIVADDSTDSDQKDGATLLAKVKEAKGKNNYTASVCPTMLSVTVFELKNK